MPLVRVKGGPGLTVRSAALPPTSWSIRVEFDEHGCAIRGRFFSKSAPGTPSFMAVAGDKVTGTSEAI